MEVWDGIESDSSSLSSSEKVHKKITGKKSISSDNPANLWLDENPHLTTGAPSGAI